MTGADSTREFTLRPGYLRPVRLQLFQLFFAILEDAMMVTRLLMVTPLVTVDALAAIVTNCRSC